MVGGWGDVIPSRPILRTRPHPVVTLSEPKAAIRWKRLFLGVIAVASALIVLPGRSSIPPLVESDYCYLLIAAERFYNGLGLTSLQPVAPFQRWEWRYDWGYLTQWPAGYPLLIAGLRWVFRCTSLEACRGISVLACAAAIVGWFTFVRRTVPRGVTALLLAGVAAASCLSTGMIINPSTDLILIAALPFIMLLVSDAQASREELRRFRCGFIVAGLLAGGLFWFRYASIFVPVAVGMILLWECFHRRLWFSALVAFAISAAMPILTLTILNAALGPASSVSAQFNLGSKVGFTLSVSALCRAWWEFTDFGFYSHRPLFHWLSAVTPLLLPLVLLIKPARFALARLFASVELRLAVSVVISLLGMLVAAAALFGAKFDYIGLERYYLPARPLYFLIFAAPLMLVPRRIVRFLLCLILASFASWTVFQDWAPTYSRGIYAHRPSTPSGAWSRPFEPDANKLYDWVREQNRENAQLLVFSNFHEYLAMETGVATLPIPSSIESLRNMLPQARSIRGIDNPQPVFVINPDNLWRNYWIDSPDQIIRKFELEPIKSLPAELQGYVLVPTSPPSRQVDYCTLTSWN